MLGWSFFDSHNIVFLVILWVVTAMKSASGFLFLAMLLPTILDALIRSLSHSLCEFTTLKAVYAISSFSSNLFLLLSFLHNFANIFTGYFDASLHFGNNFEHLHPNSGSLQRWHRFLGFDNLYFWSIFHIFLYGLLTSITSRNCRWITEVSASVNGLHKPEKLSLIETLRRWHRRTLASRGGVCCPSLQIRRCISHNQENTVLCKLLFQQLYHGQNFILACSESFPCSGFFRERRLSAASRHRPG